MSDQRCPLCRSSMVNVTMLGDDHEMWLCLGCGAQTHMPSALDEVLDALEEMVEQYLHEWSPDLFRHQFMSAGESAALVLSKHRPDRWALMPDGVRRTDNGD